MITSKLVIDKNYNYYNKLVNKEDVYVIDYDIVDNSNYINLLLFPYYKFKEGDITKSIELLNEYAKNLFKEEKENDPFWTDMCCDLFCGLALFLFKTAKEDEINLSSIYGMVFNMSNDDDLRKRFDEYVSSLKEYDSINIFCSNTIKAPIDTRSSIFAVFKQKLNLYLLNENVLNNITHNDIVDDKDIILEFGEKYQRLNKSIIAMFKELDYVVVEYKPDNHNIKTNVKHKKSEFNTFSLKKFLK